MLPRSPMTAIRRLPTRVDDSGAAGRTAARHLTTSGAARQGYAAARRKRVPVARTVA